MPKTAIITAEVEPELKERVEAIFKKMGLSVSDAVSAFFREVEMQHGLPFESDIPNRKTRLAMRDAELGKNLTRHESVNDLFRKLGI